MTFGNLKKRRLAALLSLLVIAVSVVAFNMHTDHHDCDFAHTSMDPADNEILAGRQIWQQLHPSGESNCVACKLLPLGAGNTLVAPTIQVSVHYVQESVSTTPNSVMLRDD